MRFLFGGGLGGFDALGLGLGRFVLVRGDGIVVVAGLAEFEQRIGLEHLTKLDFEFDARHLQQLDRLLQLWRQRKLLMQAEL
jgi:hypothetical protein